jgi:hypothetical protein
MSEPQALGQGPPTPWNYMVTGCAARHCVASLKAILGFRPPPSAAIRSHHEHPNRGATA